jgi:glucose/mannose-6-phosphate isomerase
LQAAGVLADDSAIGAACEEAVAELNRGAAMLTASVPAMHNPAKRLAGQMMNRLPVFLGSGLSFIIAEYWKHRLHQMAKSWSQAEDLAQPYFQNGAGVLFPEFLMQKMHCVFIAPIPAPPEPDLDPVAVYFLQNGLSIDQLAGHGRSALAQALSLIQFADYSSYYLAMAYGVDPASGLLD